VVQPNLVNCGAVISTFQNAVTVGSRLVLPRTCNISESVGDKWKGVGYYDIKSLSIGSLINGGYFGGYIVNTPPANWISKLLGISQDSVLLDFLSGKTFGDPIDIFRGGYLYSHDDIIVGQGAFPYALGFQKLYSSNARLNRDVLGNGWTHNFKVTAKVNVDGYQGMGEDSPIDAATSIVAKLVSLNLMADTAKPLDKVVIATVGQRWFADQLLDNTVVVTQGLNAEVFVKLPDGSYNPPPASNAKLIRNGDAGCIRRACRWPSPITQAISSQPWPTTSVVA
jgi:hypothetical protein